MVAFMIMGKRMRITRGGQISIPAQIQKRWATSTVTLRDEGARIVIEPAPDDPIAAAEGALAVEFPNVDTAALRRSARADDVPAERKRSRRR